MSKKEQNIFWENRTCRFLMLVLNYFFPIIFLYSFPLYRSSVPFSILFKLFYFTYFHFKCIFKFPMFPVFYFHLTVVFFSTFHLVFSFLPPFLPLSLLFLGYFSLPLISERTSPSKRRKTATTKWN